MDELGPTDSAATAPAPSIFRALPPVDAIVQARHVEKSFQRADGGLVQVIAPTDLAVEPGIIIALLGPSGSGKSTLLRMLSGLSTPSAGEVLWHGRPMAESRPNVAIVFQSFALFPWLTVAENVEVPLLALGMTQGERRRKALDTLDSVGLKGFENAYPDRKSTRLNSGHLGISYAVFCLKKKNRLRYSSQTQRTCSVGAACIVVQVSKEAPVVPFFFFNDTATPEIYPLSLHAALPI